MAEIQEMGGVSLREFFVFLVNTNRVKTSKMYEKALSSLEKSAKCKRLIVSELSESVLVSWIDDISSKMTGATVDRYVESIHTVYKAALQCGAASDLHLFNCVKDYLRELRNEGMQDAMLPGVDVVRKLAKMRRAGKDEVNIAIDVYLYSFYNAGMAVDDIVQLRLGSVEDGNLPHISKIVEKYVAPIRRYVFPLQQSQQTPKKIREKLDANFKLALGFYDITFQDCTAEEFIAGAWIAAAKACGISGADICACCSGAVNYPRFKCIQPSVLTGKQIEAIRLKVANSVVDMECHWYAIRFLGDVENLRTEISQTVKDSYAKFYYPMEEICRKNGKRRIVENRPTIRNVMFLYTMPRTLTAILRNRTEMSRFGVIRNCPSGNSSYAIIPNEQMRRFSMLVSNGLDILGEDEMPRENVELGCYVHITEGPFQGYNGRVVKVTQGNNRVTMLQIKAETFGKEMVQALGKHLYITIPQNLVSQVQPVE